MLAQVKAIQQKEADFARVKERYMFKHPVYKEIDNEITLMKANLAETVRAAGQALEQRYRVAKENELKLSNEVEQARGNAVDVEGIRQEFRNISREAEADRTLHDSVALRLRETTLAASVPASVLRWEDSPLQPEMAAQPAENRVCRGGSDFSDFSAGWRFLIGIELGDSKVRGSRRRRAGHRRAACWRRLPQIEHSGDGMVAHGRSRFRRGRGVPPPAGGSRAAAGQQHRPHRAFCQCQGGGGEILLRSQLRHLTRHAGPPHACCSMPISAVPDSAASISPERRKTPVSAATWPGKSIPPKPVSAPPCRISTCFPPVPMRADAAELLAGTRFPALLEDAYRWFDRVVIDSSPVLAVSDLLAIARYADRTCLVVRDGGSDRRELKRAAELVRSAGGTLVGFIWNESPANGMNPASPGPGVPVNRPGISSRIRLARLLLRHRNGCEIVPRFA